MSYRLSMPGCLVSGKTPSTCVPGQARPKTNHFRLCYNPRASRDLYPSQAGKDPGSTLVAPRKALSGNASGVDSNLFAHSGSQLNRKTGTAAARRRCNRVFDFESGADQIIDEINLGALHIANGDGIDQHSGASALQHKVVSGLLRNEIEFILKARAAAAIDGDPQPRGGRIASCNFSDSLGGVFGQGDGWGQSVQSSSNPVKGVRRPIGCANRRSHLVRR